MLRPTQSGEDDRGPLRLPTRTWTLLALTGAVLGLALGGQLGRWIGCALLLAAAPWLLAPLRRLRWLADNRERIVGALPIVIFAVLATHLLGDLALGRPPVSRDHGIHFFQTRLLIDVLLPSGRVTGFTDQLNSGYPYGDSYPVLGYLFTGAATLLSFGLIPLRVSYAWGQLAVWLIAALSVWWLAATIARELRGEAIEQPDARGPPTGDDAREAGEASEDAPATTTQAKASKPALAELIDPRWAGALAAIAWLIDPGASREGGWNYLMFHGVWPQLLSSALWVASLPATFNAMRRPSVRTIALAGLLLGGSVLAHPFGMLTGAVSTVAWPLAMWATGTMRKLPPGQLRIWVLVHVLAGVVFLGWLSTFLTSAGAMARSPVPWRPLGALAADLLAGELFRDHRAWVGPMALVGVIVGVRRGRGMAWLGLGLICALFVLASEEAITVLRLDLFVSAFKNLQFPRYALALKPILHAFAGIGAAVLVAKLRTIPNRDHPADARSTRPVAGRLIASLCLAPVIVGAIDDRGRMVPRPAGGVEVLEGSPHGPVERELAEALAAEAELLEAEAEAAGTTPRPMTVAFLRKGMGGGTYPLFTITDVGARLVMDGHIPAVNYKYQVRRRSPSALRLMGVTHVIHDNPLFRTPDDLRLDEVLEPVGEYGIWKLARLGPGYLDGGFVVHGDLDPDNVTLTRESDSRVLLEVAQAGTGSIDVAVGPYRKWFAAREDGSLVTIEHTALVGGIPGLHVPIDAPGTITLEYRTRATERTAMWISHVGILLLALALLWGRELNFRPRLTSPRVQSALWAVGLTGLAAILVFVYVRQQNGMTMTWADILDAHMASTRLGKGRDLVFRRDLVDTGDYYVTRSDTDGCDGTLGKDAHAGCTQEDARPRRSMHFRPPYLYRCLRVKIPENGGHVTIGLEGLREDEDVVSFYTGSPRTWDGIELELPGETERFTTTSQRKRQHLQIRAEDHDGETSFTVYNMTPQVQTLCFSIAAVEARGRP